MSESHFMTKFDGNVKFIIMMTTAIIIGTFFVGWQRDLNTAVQKQNIVAARQTVNEIKIAADQTAIVTNLAVMLKTQDVICWDRNFATGRHNDLVAIGIQGVQDSPAMTTAEKSARIKLFTSIIIKPIACPKKQ